MHLSRELRAPAHVEPYVELVVIGIVGNSKGMQIKMTTIKYGILMKTGLGFDKAVETVKVALADEGFGILTEIDVQAVLKEKLGIYRPRYLILGACNPALADAVLDAEPWAGLLLPCNVVVHELEGGTEVGFMDPEVIRRETHNPAVDTAVMDARERILRAANRLLTRR